VCKRVSKRVSGRINGKVSELLNPDDTLTEVSVIAQAGIRSSLAASVWNRYLQDAIDNVLSFKMNPSRIPALNRWLVEHGAEVRSIVSKHSFENYFLNITNDTTAKDRAL